MPEMLSQEDPKFESSLGSLAIIKTQRLGPGFNPQYGKNTYILVHIYVHTYI